MRATQRLVLSALFALGVFGCSSRNPAPVIVEDMAAFPRVEYVYAVSPGDEIHVDIQQDKEYAWKTEVLPDGSAVFRYAGQMDVMGLTLRQLHEKLAAALREYYVAPTMTLQLLRPKGPDPVVFLGSWGGGTGGGQRMEGKVVPFRKGIGLTEAIALVGGPAEPDIDIAKHVYVTRNIKSLKRTVYRFDLALAVRGGTPDLPLHPGDVVFIDNSWLQDFSRALSVVSQVTGAASQGATGVLLVDALQKTVGN
jgi:protein involved in polysaccharide export with SLBB domain